MIGDQVQEAVNAALRAANVAGGRIYDRVPSSPTFPYLTIGDEQVVDEGGDDVDGEDCGAGGWSVFADVHVWSRPVSGSKAEAKTIAAAAVAALRGITTVTGFSLKAVRLESSRAMRDPDGITEHVVVTMRFVLD